MNLLGGLVALVGAFRVDWNALEIYYHTTGRIQSGFGLPPLAVAVSFIILGFVFLFAGWAPRRRMNKKRPIQALRWST